MKASTVRKAMDLLSVDAALEGMESTGPFYFSDGAGHQIFLDGNDPDDEAVIIAIMDLICKDMAARLEEMDVQLDE